MCNSCTQGYIVTVDIFVYSDELHVFAQSVCKTKMREHHHMTSTKCHHLIVNAAQSSSKIVVSTTGTNSEFNTGKKSDMRFSLPCWFCFIWIPLNNITKRNPTRVPTEHPLRAFCTKVGANTDLLECKSGPRLQVIKANIPTWCNMTFIHEFYKINHVFVRLLYI